MPTWFPESPDDHSPGPPHRTARQQPGPQRPQRYPQAQRPASPDESYELLTSRPQQAGGELYDPGVGQPYADQSLCPDQSYADPRGDRRQGVRGYADPPSPYPDQQYPDRQYPDQEYPDRPYPDRQYPDRQYPDEQYPDQYAGEGSDRPGPAAPEDASGRLDDEEPDGHAPAQSLGRMLAAAAWPVVALGLFVSEAGSSVFGRIPAWSAFALSCLVLVGLGAFGGSQGPGSGRTWTLGVVGACGLVAFWVLLVLPAISRNTSFALTLGVVLAATAMWLTPRHPGE